MISIIAGTALTVVAALAFGARFVPIPGHVALYLVVASPYLMAAAPVALLILLWGHRWVMAASTACVLVGWIATQVPLFVAQKPSASAVPVRVMTFNMLFGRADAVAITRLAAEQADVVTLQELTPEAVAGLAAAGLETTFPYQALDARPEARGVGVYSRYPITTSERIGGYPLAMVRARVNVAGMSTDPTIVSVHLEAPWPKPIDGWRQDLGKFPGTLADIAGKAGGGAVLVGGDFNSTTDMLPFRELLTNGYQDSAAQAGAGRVLTYPANRRTPSFMGIDHVLTRDCTATSTTAVELPGSDHWALLVTVMVPK